MVFSLKQSNGFPSHSGYNSQLYLIYPVFLHPFALTSYQSPVPARPAFSVFLEHTDLVPLIVLPAQATLTLHRSLTHSHTSSSLYSKALQQRHLQLAPHLKQCPTYHSPSSYPECSSLTSIHHHTEESVFVYFYIVYYSLAPREECESSENRDFFLLLHLSSY